MAVDLEGRVVRGIDIGRQSFLNHWKNLGGQIQNEAIEVIRGLVGKNIDELPRKLKFHSLTDKQVPSALDDKKKVNSWSLHITANDSHKASFTFEAGTLYFRTCGTHADVDKKP